MHRVYDHKPVGVSVQDHDFRGLSRIELENTDRPKAFICRVLLVELDHLLAISGRDCDRDVGRSIRVRRVREANFITAGLRQLEGEFRAAVTFRRVAVMQIAIAALFPMSVAPNPPAVNPPKCFDGSINTTDCRIFAACTAATIPPDVPP